MVDGKQNETLRLHLHSARKENFDEMAKEFGDVSVYFEKWLLTTLLVGSSASFSLVAKRMFDNSSLETNLYVLLVSGWIFAISLFFCFVGIAFYSKCLLLRREEYTLKHNKQNSDIELEDSFQKIREELMGRSNIKNMEPAVIEQKMMDEKFLISQLSEKSKSNCNECITRIENLLIQIDNVKENADIFHQRYQKSINISFFGLVIGIASVLILLTFKLLFSQ